MDLRCVLECEDVLATAATIAKLGDRRRGVGEEPGAIGRIDPCACDDLGSVPRSDPCLVCVDQHVQGVRIDEALFDQKRLERANSQIDLGKGRALLRVVMIMMIVMMFVIVIRHRPLARDVRRPGLAL